MMTTVYISSTLMWSRSLEEIFDWTYKSGLDGIELWAQHFFCRNYSREEFCKLSGNIPNFGLIKRIKDTKPQYKLSRPERLQNLAGAFEADISKDLGLPILILDDICTTGATFVEMINTFKQNGLTNITCLASSSP